MARTKRKINPLVREESSAPAGKRYKTAAYVRLSVEDGGKPGADTIDGQKALLTSFIESKPDMELVAVFCDNGRTGTDFERPQFEKMREEVCSTSNRHFHVSRYHRSCREGLVAGTRTTVRQPPNDAAAPVAARLTERIAPCANQKRGRAAASWSG